MHRCRSDLARQSDLLTMLDVDGALELVFDMQHYGSLVHSIADAPSLPPPELQLSSPT